MIVNVLNMVVVGGGWGGGRFCLSDLSQANVVFIASHTKHTIFNKQAWLKHNTVFRSWLNKR